MHTVMSGEWGIICKHLERCGIPYPEDLIKAKNSERKEFINIIE